MGNLSTAYDLLRNTDGPFSGHMTGSVDNLSVGCNHSRNIGKFGQPLVVGQKRELRDDPSIESRKAHQQTRPYSIAEMGLREDLGSSRQKLVDRPISYDNRYQFATEQLPSSRARMASRQAESRPDTRFQKNQTTRGSHVKRALSHKSIRLRLEVGRFYNLSHYVQLYYYKT